MKITKEMVGKEIVIWRWIGGRHRKTYANPVLTQQPDEKNLNIFDSEVDLGEQK